MGIILHIPHSSKRIKLSLDGMRLFQYWKSLRMEYDDSGKCPHPHLAICGVDSNIEYNTQTQWYCGLDIFFWSYVASHNVILFASFYSKPIFT